MKAGDATTIRSHFGKWRALHATWEVRNTYIPKVWHNVFFCWTNFARPFCTSRPNGRAAGPNPPSGSRRQTPSLYFRQLFICHSQGYRRTSSLRLLLNKAIFLSRIRRASLRMFPVARSEVCEVSVSLHAAPRPSTRRLYDIALCYCISRESN